MFASGTAKGRAGRSARMSSPTSPTDAALVRAARCGRQAAWQALVERHDGRIAAVCRKYRLSAADAADVRQTTWLRAVEHLDRIKDPARLDAWLATVARHECLRLIRGAARIQRCDDHAPEPEPDLRAVPDSRLLEAERRAAVRTAVTALPRRDRALLALLYDAREPSYAEIGRRLRIPVGSIGPTRGRALARLRRNRRLAALAAAA
jgi:RNA polymerase sigma factor (sigma-70 family)